MLKIILRNIHFILSPLNQATSPAAGADTASDRALESKRSALQTALESYIGTFYKSDESAAGAYARNGTITVVLSSEKPNLRNYWAGRWTSTWTIKWGASVEVTGEIKVQAHYFEDGNIQLHTNRPITQSATIPASGSEADVAKAIVKHIEVQTHFICKYYSFNILIYVLYCSCDCPCL